MELFNNIDLKVMIPPSTGETDNTASVSAIIDMQGNGALCIAILTGTLGDADATFTTLLESGDVANLSDAAAVADEDLIGTEALASFTFAEDDSVFKLGYKGVKRYVRLTITPAANASAAPLAAIGILCPYIGPSANPPE